MAKYIDVDTLINTIDGMGGCDADHDTWAEGWDDAVSAMINEIEEIPAADVEPVKRGKWINDDSGVIVCSECSEEHEWQDYRAPYCDTCGAKMETPD